jgi:hypothetical protein
MYKSHALAHAVMSVAIEPIKPDILSSSVVPSGPFATGSRFSPSLRRISGLVRDRTPNGQPY